MNIHITDASISYLIEKYANNGQAQKDGMQKTPERYLKFLEEFFTPEEFEFTIFEPEKYDEMIIVDNIPFYSLCEHHMIPFFGVAHVGYIPTNKICGLSKIPRTVDMFARSFQNQERITTQIAEYIQSKLNPRGVGVVLEARHLCMEMRGIKKPGASTTTSKMMGAMRNDATARAEFFNLIKK